MPITLYHQKSNMTIYQGGFKSAFMGQMPILSSNQHCKSTEGLTNFNYITLDLSSSRIQMGALGHTLMPFWFNRQCFSFFPGQVHVFNVSFDNVDPVLPWSSRDPASIQSFKVIKFKRCVNTLVLLNAMKCIISLTNR